MFPNQNSQENLSPERNLNFYYLDENTTECHNFPEGKIWISSQLGSHSLSSEAQVP